MINFDIILYHYFIILIFPHFLHPISHKFPFSSPSHPNRAIQSAFCSWTGKMMKNKKMSGELGHDVLIQIDIKFNTLIIKKQSMLFATFVSYFYTIAWSVSFYGQFYTNYKLQSVEGMSLDFLALNICGFAFYALYSSIGFFTTIKGAGTVVLADLLFAYHALVMVLLWLVQTFLYPHGKNRLSRRAIYICIGLWGIVAIQTFLTCILKVMPWSTHVNPVSSLGYGKLILTVVKYIPVAYWNYLRQSTSGWSIFGVLSDLIGGALSLLSGLLLTHNGINMSKLGLALISICFDTLFTIQHYCLYPHSPPAEEDKFHEMNEVDLQDGNPPTNKETASSGTEYKLRQEKIEGKADERQEQEEGEVENTDK